MNRITILHICFDYPDTDKRAKTKAIKNLVESTNEFDHLIISLNRKNTPFQTSTEIYNNLMVFNVFYPRYGIFLNTFLKRIAKRIAFHLKDKNFDLIHSHKLTFEGVIGDYLSRVFNKKHIISIRGNTDVKVMRFKIFNKRLYERILSNSSQLITVAPWTSDWLRQKFRIKYKINLLPNITFLEKFERPELPVQESKIFVTAFIFERNNYKIKNTKRLFLAFKKLRETYPELKLQMIGSGSQQEILQKIIEQLGLKEFIILSGFKRLEKLSESFRNAIAFVMPSYPETFGMVYLEALASGLPILHSKKAGVDGYFSDNIAIGVNHRSILNIQESMEILYLKQKVYKAAVKDFIDKGGLSEFETEKILKVYQNILTKAIMQ